MDSTEFESKLRQVRKQKEQVEQELESSSEKWRAERRRLNAEIDRLENALADAKTAPKKRSAAESKAQGIDPTDLLKIQNAADEKLKKATEAWEKERTQLKSQINRLEGAVADAIARQNNPLRATQSAREQFEVELKAVVKEKTELEQAYLRGKTEWEQEKLKMTGEMVKLRRAAQIMGKAIPKAEAPEANPKIKDLEKQLEESLARWNSEREQLAGQIQKLEAAARQWDAERRQLNDHAAQLQQAFVQAQATIKASEVAARTDTKIEASLKEMTQQKEALQHELQTARNEWTSERQRLNSQIKTLEQQLQRVAARQDRVSSEVVDQLRQQYEQKLQETIQQKLQLAQELQSASALLEAERSRLSAEISKATSADAGAAAPGFDSSAIDAEVARVEGMIRLIVELIDNPATELSTIIRKNVEKAELDAYLKGILFSLGRSRGI